MAEIALRTYLTQIEGLIDAGRTEEALAHGRHILEQFPKNIATYRLLAKAYLEAQQHAEAADLFQRVLTSSPDDFVAHIGMSIVGEEAQDLNAAIWHMERAFEAQPSNRAVQDELRRLYTAREGYAPPKVRLTRGALARMYAHGGLHNQAISELRSALSEDPQRPDLQVLLAEMLLRSQQQNEAVQICQALIEATPYNLFANRAMAEILSREQRPIDAAPYQERVQELDPYAAQTDTREEVERVPADSVLIEKLASQDEAPAPDILEEPASEPESLPDWLSVELDELAAEDAPAGDASSETQLEAKPTSSLLESLEGLQPGPLASEDEQLELYGTRGTAALVEDSVPEWLRELGPATHTTGELPEDQAPQPRKLSWTEELRDAGLQPTQLPEDDDGALAAADSETAPSDKPQAAEAAPWSAEEDESLSWLESLAATQGAEEEELLTSPEARQAAQPDWAADPEPQPAEDTPPSEALSWLDSLEQADPPGPATAVDQDPFVTDDVPAFSETPQDAAEPVAPPQANDSLEEELNTDSLGAIFREGAETPPEPQTPSWLQELTAEMDESPSDPALRPLEETPDWLNELRLQTGELKPLAEAEAATTEEPAPAAEPPASEPPVPAEGDLDWLDELGPPKHTPASEWVPEAELGADPDPQAEATAGEPPTASFEVWEAPAEAQFADTPVEPDPAQSLAETEDWLARMRQNYPAPADSIGEDSQAQIDSPAADEPWEAAEPLDESPAPEPAEPWESEAPTAAAPAVPSPAQSIAPVQPASALTSARQALEAGELRKALQHYASLIRRRQQLPDIIADLQAASQVQAGQVELWQTLGDAYMRNDQLGEALECYTRAEELL